MPWSCFLIEPTGTAERSLRRYNGEKCPIKGNFYHDAQAVLEEVRVAEAAEHGTWNVPTVEIPHDDPRWPTRCACGYEFQAGDEWQVYHRRLYRRTVDDNGERYSIHDLSSLPIGAMWYAPWYPKQWAGPDGQILCVLTPGGIWCIDQPSQGGGRWTRSGEVPKVTARPSIIAQSTTDAGEQRRYHGWLTDGVLTDDIDGSGFTGRTVE